MDNQDHKMTATSTGHEGHGVQLCHRCGWPFPNPHPSAKHRRAHKKVCGTIEGYKIFHPEEHDHHLALSDDEDDDQHTPNPKLVKKSSEGFGSSGGVGEKSNKSEDDVFSDAVTEFSDSGISPQLEERFESASGEKSMETKGVEAVDLNWGEALKVEQIAGSIVGLADTTERVNDPTRIEEMSNQSGSGEGVSVGLITEVVESEILRDAAVDKLSQYGNGGILEDQKKDKSASITSEFEEGKISDPALIADERKEELCDKHVNTYASSGATSVDHSAEISSSFTETVGEIEGTLENNNPSVVSTIDTQVRPKTSLAGAEIAGGLDENEGEKCENAESKENFPVDAIGCVDDGQTFEKDVDHLSEGNSGRKLSETRNEMDEGASVEVQAMPWNNTIDLPSSCDDAAGLRESSKTESIDNGSHKLFIDNVTEATHSVVGIVTELKEDNSEVVASEKKTPEMQNSKDSTSVITDSELLSKNSNNDNSYISEGAEVSTTLNRDGNDLVLSENSENATPKKCSNETSPDSENVSESKNAGIFSSAELTSDANIATSEKCCVTPSFEELIPSPLDVQNPVETCAINSVLNVKDVSGVDSKSFQDDVDDKLTSNNVVVAAINTSAINSSSRSDSLQGKCGSIPALSSESNMGVADTLEISSQKQKTSMTGEEVGPDKSDTFEPPSFMTLVQPGGEAAVSDMETNQSQQPKSDALQAGWFPSLTNVVNESQGRKKNEEIIAKVVTNRSPAKPQHGPLKNLLLNEATKQVPAEYQKDDGDGTTTTVTNVLSPKGANKDIEQWNSPARYPIEIKRDKKKKKGKSYWVPFVCCSSAHRDL